MFRVTADEEKRLIGGVDDELIDRHHIRRMLISIFLCLGPLFDALLLWKIAYVDIVTSGSKLFKYFVISYIIINVSTSIIGFWGMGFRNESALRSSLVLIVMQNTLMLLFTSLVLICISFKLNLFVLHHAPLFLQYLENNRNIGIICCLFMIIIRISSYFMVWSMGELEASCDKQGYQAVTDPEHYGPVDSADLHIDINSEVEEH